MDEKTIEAYNQFAQQYDEETTDFWERFPRTFFDTFIRHITGPVLNIGSGPGRDGLILASHGIAVTCLDASHEMVAISQAKGLTSIQGDFHALPFPDASFQGVWAYTSLLHTPKKDLPNALREIQRVLTPDGIFGLGMIAGDSETYRTSPKVPTERLFSFYTYDELATLLDSQGFHVIHHETFTPNTKEYINIIATKK